VLVEGLLRMVAQACAALLGAPARHAEAEEPMATMVKRARPGDPKITAMCELKVKIGNLNSVKPKKVVIGVFGDEAPVLVRSFMEACSGRYPGESGSQVNYYLSDVKKIQKGKVITWADFKDGNTFAKQKLTTVNKFWVAADTMSVPLAGEDTYTDESNSLRHDQMGRVSMKRGGGTFDFNIAPVDNAAWLDKENVVIGQVLQGLETIEAIDKVAVSADFRPQKKIRVYNATLSILDPKTGNFDAVQSKNGALEL